MKYNSKDFKKNNHFVLYDLNDEIICYLDNWEELHNKYLKNYAIRNLVFEYNRNNTDIITIIIDDKKLRLATFC